MVETTAELKPTKSVLPKAVIIVLFLNKSMYSWSEKPDHTPTFLLVVKLKTIKVKIGRYIKKSIK